jgi:transposase-like protein
MAYKEAIKENLFLNSFIKEIDTISKLFNKSNTIFTDSQSAIELIKNSNFHTRTKHVDIRYYFIREKVLNKEINFIYKPTSILIIDILTKSTTI